MKKLLSMFLAFLCLLSPCSVKGYQTTNLPDGGKKITYSYGELEQLSEKHKSLAKNIISKNKNYNKVKLVSNIVGCGSMAIGSILLYLGIKSKQESKIWWKKALIGAGLFTLGLLSIIGTHWYLDHNIKNLKDQESTIDLRIHGIDGTKMAIDRIITNNIVTEEKVINEFYYSIFIDNQGFAHKVELGGAYIPYETVPLETQYKFDV